MIQSVTNLYYDRKDNTLTRTFDSYVLELDFLISKAEECLKLIKDYDEISDIKYYQRAKKFGIDSTLKSYDYMYIIGMANNTKYKTTATIQTKMKRIVVEEEGYGKDLEYHNVERPVNLYVLFKNSIRTDYAYSKEEVDELLKSGEIVILNTETVWDGNVYSDYVFVPEYEVVFHSGRGSSYEFEDYDGKYYDVTIKYMRIKLNKERLEDIYNKLKVKITNEQAVMHDLVNEFNKHDFEKRIGELNNK